jgi:putative ABC transport system permease protein
VLRYARRDLLHNPRRTLASLAGVTLGVGLFSGVLFFIDGSGATMTERALAPLALDMQRVLSSPPAGGLRLSERIAAPAAHAAGEGATITLTVINDGAVPANEVVVNDVPPPPLTYVDGSTELDGAPVGDVEGQSPLSHGSAGFGLTIGRMAPHATVTISYRALVGQTAEEIGTLPVQGTVSSREQVVPIHANAGRALTLEELRAQVTAIPAVAAADMLAFVDLPPGSVSSRGSRILRPVRVFAFDRLYRAHYPSIRITAGTFGPGSALLSAEAARALHATLGTAIELDLPGRPAPLSMPIGGVVDLARAEPLFTSRKSAKLEDFLYVPDSLVVTPATFRDEIVPALAHAAASVGSVVKSFPVEELDVRVDRSVLATDPGSALGQTTRLAQAIERIGPSTDLLIDNISNALAVARDDAAVGKRMFLFLGVPGLLLAAFLTAYAGGILAAVQRREHAILRVRGAHRGHLRRIAVFEALMLAVGGSLLGIALGLGSAAAILGWTAISHAATGELIVSALVSAAAGAAVATLALSVPARRSVAREVSEERREMPVSQAPRWRRFGLDLALLAAAGVLEAMAIRGGALHPPPGSVYAGVAISLPSRLLLAPSLAWIGGTLLCVRLLQGAASRLPPDPPIRSASLTGGLLRRNIERRSGTLGVGVIGLGLVVAFGIGLASFGATYDGSKRADARFVVGADLRITPSIVAAHPLRADDASRLTVPGVAAVSPVVFDLENAVVIGPFDQARQNLAAIDPSSFRRVAPPPLVDDLAAPGILAALSGEPRGVLIDTETADDLSVETGDTVEIILGLGTERETRRSFRVVGSFGRFPGTPEGANLVVDLGRYQDVTAHRHIDFFLATADDDGPVGLAAATAALRSEAGADSPIHVESTESVLDKDRSSLTALNVSGLVRLGSSFTALMSVAVVAIFVFGLIVQRRREYVTLRALGLRVRELQFLVLAEAGIVAACGSAIGVLVGSGVALLTIQVLRGLFILSPAMTLPVVRALQLAALVTAATVVAGLAGAEILRRLEPTEILREE